MYTQVWLLIYISITYHSSIFIIICLSAIYPVCVHVEISAYFIFNLLQRSHPETGQAHVTLFWVSSQGLTHCPILRPFRDGHFLTTWKHAKHFTVLAYEKKRASIQSFKYFNLTKTVFHCNVRQNWKTVPILKDTLPKWYSSRAWYFCSLDISLCTLPCLQTLTKHLWALLLKKY